MIETYLTQLQTLASQLDVDLTEACKAEKIAQTTLWRWLKGSSYPTEGKVRKIAERMKKIHAARRKTKRSS